MSINFIHIGDFHAAPGPRNADRYRALDQIITEGRRLADTWQLGAWLWPGDLFDAISATDDRNALDERLRLMAACAPVVICYGNHDKAHDLDGFANLAAAWPILVIDRPQCVRLQLAGFGTLDYATIFVLRYPHKGGLVAAGLAPGAIVATATDLLEPIFMAAAAELEEARDRGDITLMIGHVNVAGSVASTGQPNIGKEIELNPRHLDRLGPIYKGLNHIHKPQEIAGAYYAGSVARQNYGEVEEKRYLVVQFEPATPTEEQVAHDRDAGWKYVVSSRPIDIAPMFLVEGRLTRQGFTVDSMDESNDAEIHRRLDARDWSGCDVRVQYRYCASEAGILDHAGVAALFPGALRLKVEKFADADRDLRAPEVAAAKTLIDKLAAFSKVDALSPSRADKLSLLEVCENEGAGHLEAWVATTLKAIESPAPRESVSAAA